MPSNEPRFQDRASLLVTLRHALGRTLLLARELADDPWVGREARVMLSQLDGIQAEVEIMAHRPAARPPSGDADRGAPGQIWQ